MLAFIACAHLAHSAIINKAIYTGGDVQRDVTSLVSQMMKDGQLSIRVGNNTLGGDPCFGKVKSLTVLYTDNGGDYSITKTEGSTLLIPSTEAILLTASTPSVEAEKHTQEAPPVVTPTPTSTPTPLPFPSETCWPDKVHLKAPTIMRGANGGVTITLKAGTEVLIFPEADHKNAKIQTKDPELIGEVPIESTDFLMLCEKTRQKQIAEAKATQLQQELQQEQEKEKANQKALDDKIKQSYCISGAVLQSTPLGTFLYLRNGQKIFVEGLVGKADGSTEIFYAYKDGMLQIKHNEVTQNGVCLTENIEKWVFVPDEKVPREVKFSHAHISSRPGSLRSVGGGD
jgi:hypothetical protein